MSEETKFQSTPGPWFVGMDDRLVRSRGCVVAEVLASGRSDTTAANARLVAAAPEMLAALKAVVGVADRDTVEFAYARAAIAKAEGRES